MMFDASDLTNVINMYKIVKMTNLTISATDLKRETADIINEVYYKGISANITRHGKPIVRLVPISTSDELIESKNATFGAIPDFPEVASNRHFKSKSIDL